MTGLANGAIDAAWEVEPFVTISGRQRTAQALYQIGQVYPGSIANVLLLSPVFAREHARPRAASSPPTCAASATTTARS